MTESLVVGDLTFEVRRSLRRRTVGITVDRGGELILSVPADSSEDQVEKIVRQKRSWIYRKLSQKDLLFRPAHSKEFVSGESFPYLGRHYRLQVTELKGGPPLGWRDGQFLLDRTERGRGYQHFVSWYSLRGKGWLSRRVRTLAERMELFPAAIDVRDLGYRWGSCGRDGRVYFHWRVVLLPPRAIDLLIAHELAHLNVRGHNAHFWRRVERALPDFRERRVWLAENAIRYSI